MSSSLGISASAASALMLEASRRRGGVRSAPPRDLPTPAGFDPGEQRRIGGAGRLQRGHHGCQDVVLDRSARQEVSRALGELGDVACDEDLHARPPSGNSRRIGPIFSLRGEEDVGAAVKGARLRACRCLAVDETAPAFGVVLEPGEQLGVAQGCPVAGAPVDRPATAALQQRFDVAPAKHLADVVGGVASHMAEVRRCARRLPLPR